MLPLDPDVKNMSPSSSLISANPSLGVWDWNLDEGLIYADETVARLFGVDPALAERGLQPEAFLSRIHPDDRDFIEKQIGKCINSLGVCSDEFRVRSADGSFQWIYTRGRCFGDAAGRPFLYAGMAVRIQNPKTMDYDFVLKSEFRDPNEEILYFCMIAKYLSDSLNMNFVNYMLDIIIHELKQHATRTKELLH